MTLHLPEVRRAAGLCDVVEHRFRPLGTTDVAVRADEDGTRTFVGHAARFNSRTEIGNPLRWGWYEEVGSGAFDKTLQDGDQRFLVDHDTRMLVARVSAGDLRLATDSEGLAVESDLDTELSYVRDLVRNLEKRRITGMSFGFQVVRDTWKTIDVEVIDDQGRTSTAEAELRILEEVRLLEVSAVTFPAYEETDAGLRKLADEVRAARGVSRPTDSSSARDDDPAPAQGATRGDDGATPAADAATWLRERAAREERARQFATHHLGR